MNCHKKEPLAIRGGKHAEKLKVTCDDRRATSMVHESHILKYNMIGTPTFEVAASIILGESCVVRPYRMQTNRKKKICRNGEVLSHEQHSALSEPQITGLCWPVILPGYNYYLCLFFLNPTVYRDKSGLGSDGTTVTNDPDDSRPAVSPSLATSSHSFSFYLSFFLFFFPGLFTQLGPSKNESLRNIPIQIVFFLIE